MGSRRWGESPRWQEALVHWRKGVGVDLQLVIQHVAHAVAGQVPIGVAGQVDDGRPTVVASKSSRRPLSALKL